MEGRWRLRNSGVTRAMLARRGFRAHFHFEGRSKAERKEEIEHRMKEGSDFRRWRKRERGGMFPPEKTSSGKKKKTFRETPKSRKEVAPAEGRNHALFFQL